MIDIVTVVFRDEIDILRVQAQSVARYCADLGIRNIYVVVNDDDSVVTQIDPAWWGSMCGLVRVIPRSHYAATWIDNGWVTQQILKLLAAGTSDNTWSMVLDAKTILIQNVNPERIFDRQGRLIWGYYPVQPVFEPAAQIVGKLFDIDCKFCAGPAGVPFFFHNQTVRELLFTVTDRAQQDFIEWFQQQGRVTEFVLYTGYVQFRDGNLDQHYRAVGSDTYRVCNVCHSQAADIENKLTEMQNPNILTVSIHRGAWKTMSVDQRQRYKEFLKQHAISSAEELS